MGKIKSPFRIKFEFILAYISIKILEFMPLSIAYFISSVVCRMIFIFDHKHRERTIQHLLHAGIVSNDKEARALALKNIINMGKTAVEICKVNQIITPENIKEHIKFSAPKETIDLFFNKENPSQVIAITAHYGYWEFIGAAYSIIANRPMLSIMRPFDNPRMGEYINSKRQFGQHRLCPKSNALKGMLGALKKGDSVGFVADQHASETEGVETMFFGHPARTHSAPAMLHLKTGVPLAVSVLRRLDNKFNFEMIIKGPIKYQPTDDKEKDIKNVAQLYTDAIEEIVRKDPEQWLWTHRRWLDINRDKSNRKK